MTAIKFSASAQVATASSINLATAIDIEAFTKIEFVLTDKATTKTLSLGTLGDTIVFAMFKSDLNDSDATVKPKLSYKAGQDFTLDAPHIYLGQGFGKPLATAGIDFNNVTFTFTPLTDADKAGKDPKTVADVKSAKVEILVGGPASAAKK